jgi:3-methyladenine DNA glycosylase AlkD
MDQWLGDDCLWLRRGALLSQLQHRQRTDGPWLFAACLRLAPEPDFFIRNAIGWALRDYSWHEPEAVARLLEAHREALSKLSWREGAKRLIKSGRLRRTTSSA